MPRSYNFKSWKKQKQAQGKWLDKFEYFKIKNKKIKLKNHKEVIAENKGFQRQIILDTETTGLSWDDKIVELSMIEMIDNIKTGRIYHSFFNPVKKISFRATEIHNITNENVKDAPLFKDQVDNIITFIGDAKIIAHNASFDRRLLNQELVEAGSEPYIKNRFIDTLKIARFLYPKQPNNQDALCERFGIDNTNRFLTGIHSAYEDTILLYHVYLNLIKELEKYNKNVNDFILQ